MSDPAPASGQGLPKTAYTNAFVRGRPRDSLQSIQTRMRRAKIFNEELADYFAARRELEEAYLKALQKLSRRTFVSDPSTLGPGLLPLWERLNAELVEVGSVHTELERKIGEECEMVLRSAPERGEWGRIREHDDSLSNTIKEINSLESQLVKDQKKVESASAKKAMQLQSKYQETHRALNQTVEVWEMEAPFAFEAYQRIDVQRLELLKECVAKFETAQSDAAQRRMQISEQTMQECLSFDVQADMQQFMIRNGEPGGAPSRPRPESTPTATDPRAAAVRGNGANEFGAASSSSIHSGDRPAQEGSTLRSGGSTLKNAFNRIGRGRSGNNAGNTSTVYGTLPEDPRRASGRELGGPAPTQRGSELATVPDTSDGRSTNERPRGFGSMAPMTPPSDTNGNMGPPSAAPQLPAPQVDSEGFSIPPPDRKPWEMGAVGAAAGVGGAALMEEDEDREDLADSSMTTARMSSMNIAQAPIPENEAEQKAALERVRSTLLTARSPGGGPARRATTRRDRRDVRATTYNPKPSDDARPMSTFGTPQLNTDLSSSVSSQGIPTPTSAGFTGMPGLGDHRTQSMMSMSSSHMGAMAAHANPFENAGASAPGMRASITETVNVLFQGREPARIMVVGEVSISAREVISNSPLHLRLDAFEQLEKAAPNPAYLQPIADRPGEYKLDVAALLATGGATIAPGAGGQAVVLKYQLHVSESRKREYIPLDVHAQWRCEPTQTSFLLTYSANSGCRLGTSTTASTPAVQDLSFLVGIQPGTVGNVQSKPTGVWSAEKRKMYWRIPEEVPFASSTADAPTTHKLLARFAVDAESAPQPVLVRWRVPGQTVSALGLSVVADSATAPSPLNFDEIARQCISGKYLCSP